MQFTWEQQKSFDENKVLSFLPTKVEANFEIYKTLNNDVMMNLQMRTDLALQVHYATLSKVEPAVPS